MQNEAVEIVTLNMVRVNLVKVWRLASVLGDFIPNGQRLVIDAYVVSFRRLGFDYILGMNGKESFEGVTIESARVIKFADQTTKEIIAVEGCAKSKQLDVE